jgi:putative membrane protein
MHRRNLLSLTSAAIACGLARSASAAAGPSFDGLEQRYINETTATGAFSLLSSQAAIRNLTREEVRRFAGFEISEQQAMSDVFATMQDPQRLSGEVTPPRDDELSLRLSKEDQRELEKIKAGVYGSDFDRHYLEKQHAAHQSLLNSLDAYLKDGKREALIGIAKISRSQIKEHLRLIEDLQRSLG